MTSPSDVGPPAGRGGPATGPAIGALVAGCHPVPTAAVTGLAVGLAIVAGRDARGCLLVGLAILTGQLSIGWSNDAIDARRDRAAQRTDKPAATGAVAARTLGRAAVLALVCCVPLSYANGLAAGTAHLAAVGAGWAYNLGLKSTVISWLPFTLAFGLLPSFVWLGLPGAPWPPWWVTAACALLGTGAHLANVLPDRDDDQAAGVHGLAHRLPEPTVRAAMATLLAGAVAVLVLGPSGRPTTWGWIGLAAATAASALVWRRRTVPHDRTAFLVTVALAAAAVFLLGVALGAP